ncbi:MAG: PAS domain S-box protein [Candidatus Cloacimonetes bacterium]|nr:PAS domain S-box protein [Candidatus Cloacimonadota bacterium]
MNPGDVQALTDAFRDFNQVVDRFQQTYQSLQGRINSLGIQVEGKNRQLELQIHEGDNMKNFLQSILENVYTGVLVVDKGGVVTHFNRAAEEITGYKKDNVVGKNYRRLFPGQPRLSALYTLTTGKENYHRQKRIRTLDDTMRDVEFSTTIVHGADNVILGVVETFNDISEIKKLQARITQIETLAALGEMAASVAHEIRNPLGGIGGFAGLLDRKLDKSDPRRKLIKPIIEGVSRLDSIVGNLLTFTRPQKLNPVAVPLQHILTEIINFFCVNLDNTDKPVEVRTQFLDSDPTVRLDQQLFQQIVLNLLKNAYDAMDEGGVITITTRLSMPESLSDILDEDEKNELLRLFSMVEIDIADTGCGIAPEALPKLFNPFFTTKDEGNGLGLAIVKKILILHRGDVTVHSEPGQGATFTINLPLYETYEEENTDR